MPNESFQSDLWSVFQHPAPTTGNNSSSRDERTQQQTRTRANGQVQRNGAIAYSTSLSNLGCEMCGRMTGGFKGFWHMQVAKKMQRRCKQQARKQQTNAAPLSRTPHRTHPLSNNPRATLVLHLLARTATSPAICVAVTSPDQTVSPLVKSIYGERGVHNKTA